ncbi:hypothetical protein BH10PSE13_BH10PSE13_02960 [soil metagenome]
MTYQTPSTMWEKRSDQRHSLDIEAFLYFDGIGEPVLLKNISHYGALLEGRYFPPVGTMVELIADGLEVAASVIWLGPDQCGVLLSHEVEPEAIFGVRPATLLQTDPAAPI